MNLNEFVNDIASKILKDVREAETKMVLQDIIMIYENSYLSYGHYLDVIKKGNERIDEIKNKQDILVSAFNVNTTYYVKHTILEEFEFDFIRSLRPLYRKDELDELYDDNNAYKATLYDEDEDE